MAFLIGKCSLIGTSGTTSGVTYHMGVEEGEHFMLTYDRDEAELTIVPADGSLFDD